MSDLENNRNNGLSPSGKARDFDSRISSVRIRLAQSFNFQSLASGNAGRRMSEVDVTLCSPHRHKMDIG